MVTLDITDNPDKIKTVSDDLLESFDDGCDDLLASAVTEDENQENLGLPAVIGWLQELQLTQIIKKIICIKPHMTVASNNV